MRNLIPRFIQEQYLQEHYEGTFEALTMFVDVSGFVKMTQILMQGGREGAGMLAILLNGLFDLLVNAVYERGGFVATFAGDAFTAIFPINDESMPADTVVLHVLACVEKAQSIFRRHGIQTTPYGQFALQFKVGLSQGPVDWGIVGQTEKTYFFRGEAIDGCTKSEQFAEKGQVIFDENMARLMRKIPSLSEGGWHINPIQGHEGYYQLQEIPKHLVKTFKKPTLPRRKALKKKVVRCFLPDALIDFKELGEFRHVVPIFISFEGLSTVKEFDDWAFLLVQQIQMFGGYFNHLDFGDKGSLVLCAFGAPITYGKIIDRALGFMLAIKKAVQSFPGLKNLRFRVGMTYGIAYAGIVGGQKRCEYTYLGQVVNLAARFMMRAEWGEIFVSESIVRKTVAVFNFDEKGTLPYKGFPEPVPTYVLTGRKSRAKDEGFGREMIGREAELQQLREFAAPIFAGKFSGIAYIFGEAGIGKSRLAYALQQTLTEQHTLNWFRCPADQILRQPFNPFTTFFLRYFEQAAEDTQAENTARFEEKYNELIEALSPHPGPLPEGEGETPLLGGAGGGPSSPLLAGEGPEVRSELIRTKSVIGALIGLFWPESLWEQLDAKGKYNNTLAAIKNFFLAQSLLAPVIIELEDGHWIDSDSVVLLKELTRNISDVPIFIFSTLRYNDDGTKTTFQLQAIREHHLDLKYLTAAEIRQYGEVELSGSLDEEFHKLLLEKTNGNPFFVQQLIRYFRENQVITLENGTWHLSAEMPELPDTINAVLIARIDRLTEEVKEIIKTASVIGREFDVLLLSAMLKRDVLTKVRLVEKSQIWEELRELLYIFKHALLRDTAYEMQLETRRRELHQLAAETMESVYAEHLEQKYADLAYHYEKAEIRDKAIEYLGKAGDEAKARYQNHQALALYDRLLAQLQHVFGLIEVKIDTLLKKAEILELIGEWKECQQLCEEALQLAEQIDDKRRMGQVNQLVGLVCRRTGQYDKAMTYFEQARELFKAVKDRKELGRVLSRIAIVYERKGNNETAMTYHEKAYRINEKIDNTLDIVINTNNMGVNNYYQGNYEKAMTWYQKSLQLCEQLGEKLGRARVLNNIGECHRSQGHYKTAMENYEQALTIHKELGNKLSIGITFGNVGHVHTARCEYSIALASYDRAIAILRELGNKYFLSEYSLGKAEALFSLQRYEEAQSLNTEGTQLARETDSKEFIFQGNVLSAKIDFALGKKSVSTYLQEMLQQTQDDRGRATLHYELWKMTLDEAHRQAALTLYQTLYASTPNIEYKERMEELQE